MFDYYRLHANMLGQRLISVIAVIQITPDNRFCFALCECSTQRLGRARERETDAFVEGS